MKTIKKLPYMMFATIVALTPGDLTASIPPIAAAQKPAGSTGKPPVIKAPANLAKIANTRDAQIASREGYNSRSLAKTYDGIVGAPSARNSLTRQKVSAKDVVDSLSLTPETEITAGDKTLDLRNITYTKKKRSLLDATSNSLRNSVSKDRKITTRITKENKDSSPYNEFVQDGDTVVERWNRDTPPNLLDLKIQSKDGSYRIVNAEGKITSARTADGKTTELIYNSNGTMQSIVRTPRTLNILESNSMQTRAVTDYDTNGVPTKTVTYKESIGGSKTGKIISETFYDKSDPLTYVTKDASGKLLEKRVKLEDPVNTNETVYAIQVPSTSKNANSGFVTKQLITLNANNEVTKIQTFNKHENSSKDKSAETIEFNDQGEATKTITNAAGRTSKIFITDGDRVEVIRVQESLGVYNPFTGKQRFKGTTASTATVKGRDKSDTIRTDFTEDDFDLQNFKDAATDKQNEKVSRENEIQKTKSTLAAAQSRLESLKRGEILSNNTLNQSQP